MNSKQRIITTGIILSIITIIIFLFFRVEAIEKDYIKSIRKSSEKIINTYKAFEESSDDKLKRSLELEKMVSAINKKIKNLSLIVIAGLDNKIEIAGRNNKSIGTDIYDKIIYEFSRGKISIPINTEYIVRYYGNESLKRINENRFFLFSKILNRSRIFLAYKYVVERKSVIKIVIESGLILLFFIIITSLVYLISQKSRSISFIVDDDTDLYENRSSFDIDPEKKETLFDISRETVSSSIKNNTLNAINTYIYELFIRISKRFSPESLALFTRINNTLFTKSHELRQNSFIAIESRTFDTFNLNDDVYRELEKSRIMIMDSSTKSIIPILNDNSLLGFIQLIRKDGLKKDEINDIKNELGVVAGHLSEYLVVNNIMIDSNTGLFSETYFRIKYNEALQLYRKNNTDFSIIIISIFHNNSIQDKSDQFSIIKTFAPAINERVPVESSLYLFKDYLTIVLPGTDEEKLKLLSGEIRRELSRFRIKLKNGETFKTEPLITFSSTDADTEIDDPVKYATLLMENLITTEKNNSMQTSMI